MSNRLKKKVLPTAVLRFLFNFIGYMLDTVRNVEKFKSFKDEKFETKTEKIHRYDQ